MKKYIFAALLVLVSTSAMADRTESGTTAGWYTGILQEDKATACQNAKMDAERHRRSGEVVKSFSACDCEKNGKLWSCSVDVIFSKEH